MKSGDPQKTYWHLLERKRLPSEYEVVSSRLLYYVQNGFEVELPLKQWYRRFQRGSRFRCGDWEAFRDPRETTYAEYTRVRNAREAYLDGLIASVERRSIDRDLPTAWIHTLDRFVAPMLYPCHGLQMIASYVGQMSPSGRIAITCLFQAGDEIRRIQRIACRIRQLQHVHPGLGETRRNAWLHHPSWQPLRRTIEKLLVTYDWGESFVALNLVVKPLFDELWTAHIAGLAELHGDEALVGALFSFGEDAAWQVEWSQSLLKTALDDEPDNARAVGTWIEAWLPRAAAAAVSLLRAYGEFLSRAEWAEAAIDSLFASYRRFLGTSAILPDERLARLLEASRSPAPQDWDALPVERGTASITSQEPRGETAAAMPTAGAAIPRGPEERR